MHFKFLPFWDETKKTRGVIAFGHCCKKKKEKKEALLNF